MGDPSLIPDRFEPQRFEFLLAAEPALTFDSAGGDDGLQVEPPELGGDDGLQVEPPELEEKPEVKAAPSTTMLAVVAGVGVVVIVGLSWAIIASNKPRRKRNPKGPRITGMSRRVMSIARNAHPDPTNYNLAEERRAVVRLDKAGLMKITSRGKYAGMTELYAKLTPKGEAALTSANPQKKKDNPRGMGAVRSAKEEKKMQWGILKSHLTDSRDRERSAKLERKHRLDDLREECADDKQSLQLRCKLDRDSARQKARDVTEHEESFRAEKRDHYRWTAGQTAKRTRGRRYSKAESDNLALQNIDPDLRDLFMETSSQWTRDVEPDQRAELFMEWVHESPEHVADWKRRTFEEDEPDYGAEYLAYGAA